MKATNTHTPAHTDTRIDRDFILVMTSASTGSRQFTTSSHARQLVGSAMWDKLTNRAYSHGLDTTTVKLRGKFAFEFRGR